MAITEKALQARQVQKKLIPHGYKQKIAEMAGVSEQTVCSYWKGESSHAGVAKAIKEVLELVAKNEDMIQEVANNILTKIHTSPTEGL